jgi:hypothetical protein
MRFFTFYVPPISFRANQQIGPHNDTAIARLAFLQSRISDKLKFLVDRDEFVVAKRKNTHQPLLTKCFLKFLSESDQTSTL